MDCHGRKSAETTLSYVVAGASWHPEYDLRFDNGNNKGLGKGQAELTVAVIVKQSTTEDWRGVNLILSTAKPKLGVQAPLPGIIRVNGRAHKENKVIVQAQERRDSLKAAAAPVATSADFEDKGNAFAIQIGRKVDIYADGRPYWLPAVVIKTKAVAKLVAVPKRSPYVYNVVTLNNPASFGLMPGVLHAYRGSAFMGDSHLRYKAPGEAMEVSLGIDESVRATREVLGKFSKKGGVFSSDKKLMRGYRITLDNRSGASANVEIRENIPVSKTKEVVVKLDTKRSSGKLIIDAHRGFVSWNVKLSPRKNAKRDLVYSIQLPESWSVR